jgi:hypothetical protein
LARPRLAEKRLIADFTKPSDDRKLGDNGIVRKKRHMLRSLRALCFSEFHQCRSRFDTQIAASERSRSPSRICVLLVLSACRGGGGAAPQVTTPPMPVIVAIAPQDPSVHVSRAQMFSATLLNDTRNLGVMWSLRGCTDSACGTLSNATTTSVIYTPPAVVMNPTTNILTATAIADTTKSVTTTITIAAAPRTVAVILRPQNPVVQVSQSQKFNARLPTDAQNQGMTWSLSGCADSGCGTLSEVTATSVTYTAPAEVPNPAVNMLTITSIADATKSTTTLIAIVPATEAVAVTLGPQNPAIQVAQSRTFGATLLNDTRNLGVTWSLTGCTGSACGTLSNATTTSVTYTAPIAAPDPATNVLTATSVADAAKSMTTTIAITNPPEMVAVTLSPKRAAVAEWQSQQFTATLTGDAQNLGVIWTVDAIVGGNSTSGTISSSGMFTPGANAGVHAITATSVADASRSATVTIAVTDLAGVFTYHNDGRRTGLNAKEYALGPSTLSSATFGNLFSCALDAPGYVYAQPLYAAGLMMGDGRKHNVVFVATESDWVYAFDADSSSCQELWRTRVLKAGETTVPSADTGEVGDLMPEIGVTSTPVIDASTNTLYVCAKSKDSTTIYHHRLYALELVSGALKLGSPVEVTAPNFGPLYHLQRPALLLSNGTVFVAFGSHGDQHAYQGWLMGYDASTLAKKFAWSSTDPRDDEGQGAVWMAGNGPSVDAAGNVYVETSNGAFDADTGGSNYANSVVKLSSSGSVIDFFTPSNQATLTANDVDLGSSGPVVLPDSLGSTAHPHLLLATGKTGVMYLLDRDNLGKFNSTADKSVQEVVVKSNTTQGIGGVFGQPAVFKGALYVAAVDAPLARFDIANAAIVAPMRSQTSNKFMQRGATPSISANGTTNGVVWALDIGAYPSGPAVLYAYDATNLANKLYASPTSGSGTAGSAVKFTVPTVANGKVYVGGQGSLTVFGLLPN